MKHVKSRIGTVVSNKMSKTVVVSVTRQYKHKLYGKILSARKKYKAHDENNQCQVGDLVLMKETRHLSKDKYWAVEKVLRRSSLMEVAHDSNANNS